MTDVHAAQVHMFLHGLRVLDLKCGDLSFASRVIDNWHRYLGIDMGPDLAWREYHRQGATFLAVDITRSDEWEIAAPWQSFKPQIVLVRNALETYNNRQIGVILERIRNRDLPCLITTTPGASDERYTSLAPVDIRHFLGVEDLLIPDGESGKFLGYWRAHAKAAS